MHKKIWLLILSFALSNIILTKTQQGIDIFEIKRWIYAYARHRCISKQSLKPLEKLVENLYQENPSFLTALETHIKNFKPKDTERETLAEIIKHTQQEITETKNLLDSKLETKFKNAAKCIKSSHNLIDWINHKINHANSVLSTGIVLSSGLLGVLILYKIFAIFNRGLGRYASDEGLRTFLGSEAYKEMVKKHGQDYRPGIIKSAQEITEHTNKTLNQVSKTVKKINTKDPETNLDAIEALGKAVKDINTAVKKITPVVEKIDSAIPAQGSAIFNPDQKTIIKLTKKLLEKNITQKEYHENLNLINQHIIPYLDEIKLCENLNQFKISTWSKENKQIIRGAVLQGYKEADISVKIPEKSSTKNYFKSCFNTIMDMFEETSR